MISYMGSNNTVRRIGGNFMIGTTSDTRISPGLYNFAAGLNIQIFHYKAAYRMISGDMQIKFPGSSTTMLK